MRSKGATREVESDAALYALGALPKAESDKFRQRLAAGCSLCQGLVEECDEVVTMLLLSAPEVEPAPGLRARLLASIAPDTPATQAGVMGDGILVRAGEGAWLDAPAPGVQYRQLNGPKTMLVRMAPKTWLPAHDHNAGEQCLVLEGSITSEGVTAYAGDYTFMPKGSVHSAIYSETGAVFLIAYS